MSIVKIFNFGNSEITTVKNGDDIWFKGKEVASALGYKNSRRALERHVDVKYKARLEDFDKSNKTEPLSKKEGSSKTEPPLNSQPHTVFIKEPGLYSLVFGSKLESARKFQDWVFSVVLPSIRKSGSYQTPLINNQLRLLNETDLHYQIIRYIRKYHPSAIIVPGLGEMQDESKKRLDGWAKGYKGGQPDLLLINKTPKFSGLAIELKTPNGKGILSPKQHSFLAGLSSQGFKTIVTNDYDELHRLIDDYFSEVRIGCPHCRRNFKTQDTLGSHLRWFHRINT